MKKVTLVAVLLAISNFYSLAQINSTNEQKDYANHPYWIEMMQDPNANFFETVKAFDKYWENREITTGSGYKPFKRWEYYWAPRVNPDGTRRPADAAFKSYFEFQANNQSARDEFFEGDWENLGPVEQPDNAGTGQPNGNGRINDIEFHPTDPDIIYIGAPAGGLWFTVDGGENWVSFTDDLPTLGVSSIAIDYTDTDIVYIGTGDRDAGDAVGLGVMKSNDAGVSFETANSGMGNVTVGRLIIHPDFHNELLAATSSGIYKTTNGGNGWSKKESGNFKDIVYKVDDPDVVFATSNGDFYRSVDGGDTWTEIDGGFTGSSRGVIGVSEADADVVYFHTVNGSVYNATYRSDDAGLTFTQKATSPNIMSWECYGGSGGQGWYDLDVAVDPTDADVLYSGGVNVWKSSNGASSWSINSHWYGGCGVPSAHADCHVLEYNPLNNRLYSGNDGGIYWTENAGQTWNEITSGLAISQVYKIGQARQNKDKVINGYQDNGTATYLGEENGWLTVMGGDGMDCSYDHQDDSYAYGEYYNGGGISRIYNNNNQGSIGNGISESGAWVTPIMLDVVDPVTMYVGMKNIWVSHNIRSGNVQWSKITDFGGSSNHSVIEQSEADPNIFYSVRSNQSLNRSDNVLDEDPSWTDLTSNLPTSGVPTDIEAHPFNTEIVYMTLNYKVYKSEDRGLSWENITYNLPNASTNTIEYYRLSEGGLYVGTDAGIYYKDDNMDEWISFSEGFPVSANVTEIEVYYDPVDRTNDAVRASTYGRGLWSSPTFYTSPVADFESNETQAPLGCEINFFDLSYGVPHEWSWTFEGGTPSTSDEQNPTGIIYTEEGTYEVSLTVTNPAGTDSKTVSAYITIDGALLPEVNFTTDETLICTSQSVQFFDESGGCPTNWFWEFEPATVNFIDGTDANSQHPVIEFSEGGAYSVTLTVENAAGESSETRDDYIYAGGYLLPFTEDFQGESFIDMEWTVDNPDGKKSWDLTTLQDESQAAFINFYNYTSLGERDLLMSPIMNFEGFDNVFFSFEYAYAQRYFQKDSLIVKLSDDCGEIWTRVYANGPDGDGIFETAEPSIDYFEPTKTDDWCGSGYGASCPVIDLSEWANQANIMIAFETYNQYGNNLYLKNIEVSNTVGIINTSNESGSISIYPNPANTFVNILNNNEKQVLTILRIDGSFVQSFDIKEGTNQINTKGFSKGIYLLKFAGKDGLETKKLIIH